MKDYELFEHIAANLKSGRAAGAGLINNHGALNWIHPTDVDLSGWRGIELAPRMVRINGIEVKAGMSEAPEMHTEVYMASTDSADLYLDTSFDLGNKHQKHAL